MRTSRLWTVLTAIVLLLSFAGCNRDPNVKKQKYLESGNRYFEQGKYREAEIQFQNAVQIDPRFAQAHYRLANTYARMHIWPDSYRELQRTIELDPGNLKAQVDLGRLLIGAKSYDQAQTITDKILQQDPNNADAHILLGDLAQVRHKPDIAIQEIQKAISLDPNRPQYYLQLAAMQANARHFDAAEATMKKVLEVDPKFTAAMEGLSLIYQNQGRWPEAEAQIRHAIDVQPGDVELRLTLARLYDGEGRQADAEKVVLQAKKDLGDTPEGYRALAHYYVALGDKEKALTEFASITQQHPLDLRAREDYIQLLLAANRLDEASRLNDEILKSNPKDSGAQLNRGRIMVIKGQFSDAIPLLEGVVKSEPENALAHYQLGVALNATGDLGRSEQEWREAAELAPQLDDAQIALSQVAIRKNDLDLLDQAAEQMLRNNPFNPLAYLLRAQWENDLKQTPAAEADIKKAIEIAPSDPAGYTALAKLRVSQNKLEDAQKYFEQALSIDPNHLDSIRGLVGIFLRRKQPDKAIALAKSHVEKSPNNDALYTLLGDLQASEKNYPEAETSLQKTIALNPSNVAAFLLLEKVDVAMGSTDKALATAYHLIQQSPQSVQGYVLAADLENSSGNWQKAQELYQKALRVQPDDAPAANNLAYLMLEHGGNTNVALSLAQTARRAMPDSPMAADTLAWAYYQKGTYGMAADLLQEALQNNPDDALVHYHLGMVYKKQNNPAQAKIQLERSLKIAPNSPQAEEIRKVLSQLG